MVVLEDRVVMKERQLAPERRLAFGRAKFCAKVGSFYGSTYETKSGLRILQQFYIMRGGVPGRCSAVCKTKVCNHQPCTADYLLDEEACTCIKGQEPLSACSQNTFCENDKCFCKAGFKGTPIANSVGCSDINECLDPTLNNCGPNTNCVNTPGSFTCSCKNGFNGTNPASPQGCTDINECNANPAICGPQGTCENTVGGRACRCNAGYVWDSPDGICNDINECTNSDCGPNSLCTNTPGSRNCTCLAGYNSTAARPSVAAPCTDINECANNSLQCGGNATCANIPGSFNCACNIGYEGTPPFCTPNACTRANQTCGQNTFCNVTTPSAPVCACLSTGYERNPVISNNFTCTDINECGRPGTCAATQDCLNQPGTFFCGTKAWNACPSKLNTTCFTGLQCAQTSGSDATYVCCPIARSCTGGSCCNDAYKEGDLCRSRLDDDCDGRLVCAPTSFQANTPYQCCSGKGPLGLCV